MSLLGPLIGRALSGVEDPVVILPDNTCQDLSHFIQMVWDQVWAGIQRGKILNCVSVGHFSGIFGNFLLYLPLGRF